MNTGQDTNYVNAITQTRIRDAKTGSVDKLIDFSQLLSPKQGPPNKHGAESIALLTH